MSWLFSSCASSQPRGFVPSLMPPGRAGSAAEVVVQTLREHAARQMARAAEAKVERSPAAFGAYEVADAFQAAVEMLDHDDLDDQSTMLRGNCC